MEGENHSRVLAFNGKRLQKHMRQLYWCTSSSKKTNGWGRVNLFGWHVDALQKQIKGLTETYDLSPTELLFFVEDGQTILRVSPNVMQKLGVEATHILPPGQQYGRLVDAFMQVYTQEAQTLPADELKAEITRINSWTSARVANTYFRHNIVQDNELVPRLVADSKQKHMISPVVEEARGLAQQILIQYFTGYKRLETVRENAQTMIESVLAQAENEAMHRCFPHMQYVSDRAYKGRSA